MKCDSEDCVEEMCSQEIMNNGLPSHLVQIRANNAEMKQRIEELITGKRMKTNKKTELEFFDRNFEQSTCARHDAVLRCKRGAKSHLDVCSVWNDWGPHSASNIKLHQLNSKNCCCSSCVNTIHGKHSCVVDPTNIPHTFAVPVTQQPPSSTTSQGLKNEESLLPLPRKTRKRYGVDEIDSIIDFHKKYLAVNKDK